MPTQAEIEAAAKTLCMYRPQCEDAPCRYCEGEAKAALEALAKENERLQQRIDLECDSYARDAIRAKTIEECLSDLERTKARTGSNNGRNALDVAMASIRALAKPPAEPVATIDSVP
jgi:hypothetical protein